MYFLQQHHLIDLSNEHALCSFLPVFFSSYSFTAQVPSLFQGEFSTECHLVFPLSIPTILSFL